LAAEKHVHKEAIYAERGTILDANNEVLAHNVPVQTVTADATHLNNIDAAVELVSDELKIPRSEIAEKLQSGRQYVVLKREVPCAVAESLLGKLRAQDVRGIEFHADATRLYPNGSMLCHVIGFTDFEHRGIQGVEASMEDYLHGQDGYRYLERNRAGKERVLYCDKSARRATVTRFISRSISICKPSWRTKSTPPCANIARKRQSLF
jgi:cell division protein FtsI/penicillin-binding protein 2